MKITTVRGTRGRKALRMPLALAAAVVLCACDLDSVLEVEDPDVATPESIQDPENLSGLRFGALGDFMVALARGGNTEGIILSSGLLSDELYVSDTFGTRHEVDRRRTTVENSGMTVVFRNLHRARRSAEVAAENYAANMAHDRYSDVGHAEVTNLAAYTYLLFGENYCSGVPFSRLTPDNRLEHGPPWTTQQMFDYAVELFRVARNLTSNATQANLSRIGEARTLMNLGQYTAAAELVAAVPTSFVYEMQFSENSERQNNGVWAITHSRRGYGVGHLEGGNGLPFRQGNSQDPETQDPRVPYTRNNFRAFDFPFAHFWQLKYPERGSAVPFATGIEARLIEAEAALATDVPTFVAKHNELRAARGLAVFDLADVTAMTPTQREDLHFSERAFWLYLTGQRLSDLRRLARQYGRATESVFPTGTYGRLLYAQITTPDDQLEFRDHGVTYGTDVSFPVPFDELNNPNAVLCDNTVP